MVEGGDGSLPEHSLHNLWGPPTRYSLIVDGELGPMFWCLCKWCWRMAPMCSMTNGRRFIRAQRRARKARRGYP